MGNRRGRTAATAALALLLVAVKPVISAEPVIQAGPTEKVRQTLETALLPIWADTVSMPAALGMHAIKVSGEAQALADLSAVTGLSLSA